MNLRSISIQLIIFIIFSTNAGWGQIPLEGIVTFKCINTRTFLQQKIKCYYAKDRIRMECESVNNENTQHQTISLFSAKWNSGCAMIFSSDFIQDGIVLSCNEKDAIIYWERIFENPQDTFIYGYRCQQVVYRVNFYNEFIDYILDTVYYSKDHYLSHPINLDWYTMNLRSDYIRLPIAVVSWTYVSMSLKDLIENYGGYSEIISIDPKQLVDDYFDPDDILKEILKE